MAVLRPRSHSAHKDNTTPAVARTNPSILIHVGKEICQLPKSEADIHINMPKLAHTENTSIVQDLGVSLADNQGHNHDQDAQIMIRITYKGRKKATVKIAKPRRP